MTDQLTLDVSDSLFTHLPLHTHTQPAVAMKPVQLIVLFEEFHYHLDLEEFVCVTSVASSEKSDPITSFGSKKVSVHSLAKA